MSLLFEYIDNHPKESKRLIGIDYESLQQLMQQALLIHQSLQAKKEKEKSRVIAAGGGRPPSLTEQDEILLTLSYLRQNTSFQWLGIMFEVSETTANTIFHYWLEI